MDETSIVTVATGVTIVTRRLARAGQTRCTNPRTNRRQPLLFRGRNEGRDRRIGGEEAGHRARLLWCGMGEVNRWGLGSGAPFPDSACSSGCITRSLFYISHYVDLCTELLSPRPSRRHLELVQRRHLSLHSALSAARTQAPCCSATPAITPCSPSPSQMPPRRSPSPLSFETCPQAADLDTGSIAASDDELDEAGHASQRRRIEKLAESCRWGAPPFILSASLQGPFDQGWVNPWRKNRKRKAGPGCGVGFQKEVERAENHVVQETDAQRRRQRRRYPTSSTAPPESDHGSPARLRSSISPERERGRYSRLSSSKLNRSTSGMKEAQAPGSSQIRRQSNDDWLKRNPKYPCLAHVDSPSSPTNKLSTRRLDAKPLQRRSMEHSTRHSSRSSSMAGQKETAPPASKSTLVPRPESVTNNNTPHSTELSRGHPNLPASLSEAANPEASICILSSSSHFPKFEYRRRKKSSSKKRRSKSSSIPRGEEANPSPSTHGKNANAPDSPRRATPEEGAAVVEHNQIGQNHQATLWIGNSKADAEMPGPYPAKDKENNSTAAVASEELPSAQPVSNNLGITDYEPSLETTSVPKSNPDHGGTSPGAQLSTQAALLLAQQSFKNDLNTPEHAFPTTSERKMRPSQSPSRKQPPHVTPFHRLNTPNPDASESSRDGVDGPQMMSTQYMIDATTPFTVSTEKSNKRSGASTKSRPSSKKRKKASFAMPSSPLNELSLHGNRTLSKHRSAETGRNSHDMHQSADNQSSESQRAALPFLAGSTPPTAQDGQGAEPADSFNLSQAIAEAGSWLQQSFDLNMEMKECSKAGPSAAADDVKRSAMSLDTIH